MPVAAFCYGSKEQLDCLARLELHTIEDMWRYIQLSTPPVNDSDLSVVIHKRHVIGFCTHRCNGIFFDFDKLYRERGVVLGGMWPNQWIALRTTALALLRPSQSSFLLNVLLPRPPYGTTTRMRSPKQSGKVWIRHHLEMMPPSPRSQKARPAQSPCPNSRNHPRLQTDPLIDLCCPITLELFKDPVKTIHGQRDIRTIRNRGLAFDSKHRPNDRRDAQDQSRLPR